MRTYKGNNDKTSHNNSCIFQLLRYITETLRAKVTPSLHLKDSKKCGEPGVGIDKHNIACSLFVNISIKCRKEPYFKPT